MFRKCKIIPHGAEVLAFNKTSKRSLDVLHLVFQPMESAEFGAFRSGLGCVLRAWGVDVAIEAVGLPSSFDTCQKIVAVGGRIAGIGVHGKPVQFDIDTLWSHNITLTTSLVDTFTTPMLLKTVIAGKVEPKQLITHHFHPDEILLSGAATSARSG